MTSVMRTKTAKIEMLIAGLPMLPSAASSSGTGGPLGRVRAGVAGELVVLEPVAHIVGDRVGVLVRVRHVEVGDHEGGHELEQAEDEADVDVPEDLGGHEVV